MAGNKKTNKDKGLTVKTVIPPKKGKKREKKPTVTVGGELPEEKIKAKAVAAGKKRGKKTEGKPAEVIAPSQPEAAKEEPKKKIKVTFVCTGNTCRSAMARYLFEDYLKSIGEGENFEVAGAGLAAVDGDDMSEYAKAALTELGITEIAHWARLLTPKIVENSDLIVCMTEAHRRAVGSEKAVTPASLTGGRDISDPYGGSLDDYRRCAAELKRACPYVFEAAKRL